MPRLYIATLLTLLLMPLLSAAPLHYFREDDRVGLKDEAGRVLVPARYPDIGWTVYDEDPQGGEIEFITSIHQPHAADDAPAWALRQPRNADGVRVLSRPSPVLHHRVIQRTPLRAPQGICRFPQTAADHRNLLPATI